MKKQQGFVLVSVLIITTITTMLAFSQISENRLQERMGGNQQKELNARLAAEKGLFEAFDTIKGLNLDGKSNEYIKDQLDKLSGDDYSFPSVGLSGNTFTLISKGEVNGAIAYLKTEIEAVESSGIFDDAIVACEKVSVWGNGNVDSFSVDADGNRTSGANGNVSVIGDITDSNVLKYKSGSIKGSISEYLSECDPLVIANNMPTPKDSITPFSLDDVRSSGTLKFGETLEEEEEEEEMSCSDMSSGLSALCSAADDAYEDRSEAATDLVDAEADVVKDCKNQNNPNQIATCNAAKDVAAKAATAFEEAVEEAYKATAAYDDAVEAAAAGDTNTDTNTESTETDTDTAGDDTDDSSSGSVLTTDMYLFDDTTTTPVYVFESLDLQGENVEISGDVIFYIEGDMTIKQTTFTLADDNSSLTIFTKGKVSIETNSDIFSGAHVKENNKVPLTIYSSNDSEGNNKDAAVYLQGNAEIYMNLYAPKGEVNYQGGSGIFGALRGKKINITGTGDIHYDEGLSGMGGSGEAASASYSSVYYHYE